MRGRRASTSTAVLSAGTVAAGLLGLPMAGTAAAVPGADSAVFVNEIHYDNDGTDDGEAVEVAAPAGTDLTGWSVVLYNGNGGGPYATLPLGGTVPDLADGWGVVTVAAPGMQNGDPDGLALVDGTALVQFLSYEGTFSASTGVAAPQASTDIGVRQTSSTPAGRSLQLTGTGTAYGDFTWTGPAGNTFGALNAGQSFGDAPPPPPPPPAECGLPATPISSIQGAGPSFDPEFGGERAVEGVVTAVTPGLDGFFLQEEAGDVDGDPRTSEGIFVYTRTAPTVAEGSVVRVTGTVAEYVTDDGASSKTQLTQPLVEVCAEPGAVPVPAPAPLTFPVAAVADLEAYEGMLVELVQELVISEYFDYDRYGEVVLALPPNGWDRQHTPTAVVEPGPPAQALADLYARSRITLDDASSAQNPQTVPHPGNGEPFTLENRFRGGDTVTGVVGVVDDTFGKYRIQPTAYGDHTVENPRPTEAPAVGGRVQVASFNVLNYFLTLDNGRDDICGPERDVECRGADDAQELQRQRAKILAALERLDADVVGLIEMENTPGVEPAADLVAGLNDRLGAGSYDYVDTGVIGTDAIRVGFIYRPAAVTPVGDFAVLDSSVDPRFLDAKNRPALVQTFDEVATGARFTATINHFKSKGSDCDDVGDPDTGDGQGNCNGTRTLAARALADFLATDPTGSGDPDVLVLGDLNSYDEEDPISALLAAGYVDQVERFGGEYAYGYVFDGQTGYLDHALATGSLSPQVTGAAEWHINADEPDLIDYDTSFKSTGQDALYAPDPYRSSDHDPVLVGLDLAPATPDACYVGNRQQVGSYEPGRRGNGTAVPPAFRDAAHALGRSDPAEEPYWVSLGLGGEVVLEFAVPVQNGAGTDLRVVDAADGAKGRADAATVYASADGTTWVELGRVDGTGEVDLGDLLAARYVRVVDATSTGHPAADGYDLDAVEVLSGCAG
jgi:predicted extracellular nuclease